VRILGWGKEETEQASDRTAAELVSPAARADVVPPGKRGAMTAAATRLVERLLDVGIDGKGPFDSASVVAAEALSEAGGSVEKAIGIVRRDHRRLGALGGFATGLGGFFTMPISLPANVVEFYILGTRMTAAIAKLRGYDIDQPEIRSAILVTLTGAESDAILKKAGLAAPGGRIAALAVDRLPPPALMVVNKAVGFRLLGKLGDGVFAKLGRGVPFLGGAVGGGMDVYLLGKIAKQAEQEFPPVSPFAA
jgi:hypothetical protein